MSTTVIPLRLWIHGALERGSINNNGNFVFSPAYLASALRIAISLTQQVSDVEELSKSGLCHWLASLPPPFPAACIDWADCITVCLKQNDDVCERGESSQQFSVSSFLSPSDLKQGEAGSRRDDHNRTAGIPQQGNHQGFFNVEYAQILYSQSAANHVDSPREKLHRIYSLGLVLYELFSGGELPPLQLLVVSSRNGDDLTVMSSGQLDGEGSRTAFGDDARWNDFASTLTISNRMSVAGSGPRGDNVEHYEASNEYPTNSISNKRQHVVSSRSRQSVGSTRGAMLCNVSVECLGMKGVPSSLCDLVRNMIDCINGEFMGNESYSELVDVTRDLQLMLDKPSVYLHNLDADKLSLTGLEMDDTLFDRNDEFASLQSAYQRSISGSSELAIITGMSGTGKSTMAYRLGNFITSSGGLFLSGKFDQMMQHVEPFSAVASAFNNFCNALAGEGNTERAVSFASKLRTALGSDLLSLIQVIPSLSQIIHEHPTDRPCILDDCVDGQQRLQYLFSQFVEAIASCSEGLVTLFMDDLQWADPASISIIGQLLRMSHFRQDGKRVFFLGTCRDDEMKSDHSFWNMIYTVSAIGFKTTLVKLGCMDRDTLTQIVSNLLHLSPRLVSSLADIVYHTTKGNPLFVSKMLLSLNKEGLLSFSLARHRWEWDVEKIQLRKLPDDVAMFFVRNINTLPIDVKLALSVLSCFGASTECEVVQAIETDLNLNLIEPLKIAIAEGLLNKFDGRYYCFCHDRIHEATYSMIEEQDRCLRHMKYGMSLMNLSLRANHSSLLFTAATQLNLGGPSAVQHAEEYNRIASYNLTAGKRAIEMSDFSLAFSFFDHGISFLRKKHWQDQYDLSLELFNLAAKCALTIKDLTSLTAICDGVVKNARSFEDTLNISFILMSSLTYSMISESVGFGFQVLSEQLGITIPHAASREDTLELIFQTQSILDEIEQDTLLSYNVVTDFKKLMAMKFLAKLETSVLQVNSAMLPYITIKMVQLTIEHGLSPMSAIGFAYFGGIIAELGDIHGGYRYTRLANALLDKHPSNEIAGEVILQSTEILAYIEPLQAVNKYRIQGQATAMAAGDVHLACLNKLMFICPLLWSGVTLLVVKEASIKAGHFSEEHNHQTSLYYYKILDQTISKLIDDEGQTLCDDQLTSHEIENMNPHQLVIVYFHKMFLSLVFNNFDEMKLSAEKFFEVRMTSWLLLSSHAIHYFIGGLASFRIYRETHNPLWAERGKLFKQRIKSWTDQGSLWNFENKSFLLDAESSYSDCNSESAQVSYDNAISSAQQHKFTHEEALAYELAANFYLNTGNKSIALKYFISAHRKYSEWGAFAKVRKLDAYMQEAFRCSPSAALSAAEPSNDFEGDKTSNNFQGDNLSMNNLKRRSS